MKEHIQRLLKSVPFTPFVLEVGDEVAYPIATTDHVLAAARVLFVMDDNGDVDVIPYEHIRRLRYRDVAA